MEEPPQIEDTTTVVLKPDIDTTIESIRLASTGEVVDSGDFEFLTVFNSMGDYYGIAYGSGKFVAVGRYGRIQTSDDGVTWTGQADSTKQRLRSVIWNGSKFVVVGDAFSILTSTDGIAWTGKLVHLPQNFYGIAYGNGRFVAVGKHALMNNGIIYTSDDGAAWTEQTLPNMRNLNGIAFGDNIFVAAGDAGTIFTSPDGTDWTANNSGVSNLNAVAYGNGTFMAVGNDTIAPILKYDADNGVWANVPSINRFMAFVGIAYSKGTFVIVSNTGQIYTSNNGGTTWTLRTSETVFYPLRAVCAK